MSPPALAFRVWELATAPPETRKTSVLTVISPPRPLALSSVLVNNPLDDKSSPTPESITDSAASIQIFPAFPCPIVLATIMPLLTSNSDPVVIRTLPPLPTPVSFTVLKIPLDCCPRITGSKGPNPPKTMRSRTLIAISFALPCPAVLAVTTAPSVTKSEPAVILILPPSPTVSIVSARL